MLLLLFTLPIVTIGKLVIPHDKFGEYSIEDVKAAAEFIKTEIVPHPTCDGVEESHEHYKLYVIEIGRAHV